MRLSGHVGIALLLASPACLRDAVPVDSSPSGGDGGAEATGGSASSESSTGTPLPSTTSTPPQTGGSTSQGPDSGTADATGPFSTSTGDDGALGSTSSGGAWCGGEACGDGLLNCTEECDCGVEACTPEGLGFATCVGMVDVLNPDHVFTGGEMGCNMASCRYDFSGCEWGCGDGIIGDGETCEPKIPTPSCAELGRGKSAEPIPCAATCQLDTSVCL